MRSVEDRIPFPFSQLQIFSAVLQVLFQSLQLWQGHALLLLVVMNLPSKTNSHATLSQSQCLGPMQPQLVSTAPQAWLANKTLRIPMSPADIPRPGHRVCVCVCAPVLKLGGVGGRRSHPPLSPCLEEVQQMRRSWEGSFAARCSQRLCRLTLPVIHPFSPGDLMPFICHKCSRRGAGGVRCSHRLGGVSARAHTHTHSPAFEKHICLT